MSEAEKLADVSWNKALEELLCEEAEKCSGLSWLHNKAEMLYSNRTTYLQLPIIIFSAISGFASGIAPADAVSQASVGAVSILVAILGSINSYFGFAKRSEGHRIAAIQYAQMCRALRIEMNLPEEQRTPPKVLLRMIKEDLKRLSETAPRVPVEMLKLYRQEIVPHSENVSHPEITNGIESVKPYHAEEVKNEIVSPKPEIRVRFQEV